MIDKDTGLYYFRKYIKVAPFALALWRTQEAASIAQTYAKLNQKYHWTKNGKDLVFPRPILDLGCGFGEFSGVFFNSQIEMGIDVSLDDLIMAKKINKYSKLRIADARKLPFPQNKFATVISLSVLEHILGADQAIKETFRVLKPGGLFIFTMPTVHINQHLFFSGIFNKLGFTDAARWYIKKFHQVFKHVNLYTKNHWVTIAKKSGFKILEVCGTVTPDQILTFDLFLLSALPSQIIRMLFGTRGIWALSAKSVITEKLYTKLLNDNRYTNGNILIIAKKP